MTPTCIMCVVFDSSPTSWRIIKHHNGQGQMDGGGEKKNYLGLLPNAFGRPLRKGEILKQCASQTPMIPH